MEAYGKLLFHPVAREVADRNVLIVDGDQESWLEKRWVEIEGGAA